MSKKLYEKMNLYLANQEVAYIKLHNLHWYVKGRSFFTLHAKLEELYDRTAEIIDAVAERLLAVGQAPVANMKEALALATIKELADKPISSEETVQGYRRCGILDQGYQRDRGAGRCCRRRCDCGPVQ